MKINFKKKLSSPIDTLQCNENTLIESKRYGIKKLLIIIASIGFCFSLLLVLISAIQNAEYFTDNIYTYRLHQIPGQAVKTYGTSWFCYCDICCRFNGAYSIDDFVLDKFLSEPYYLIPIVIAALSCCLLYFISHSSMLTVTNKRIIGQVAGIKKFDIPLSFVSSITPINHIKGIDLSTPSIRILVPMIKNFDDVYKVINNLLSEEKQNYVVIAEDINTETSDDVIEDVEDNSEIEKSLTTSSEFSKSIKLSENIFSTQQSQSKLKKAKNFFIKHRKQTIFTGAFILILCLCILGFLNNSNNSDYNSNNNYSNNKSYTPQNDYDESYLETLAVSQLYDKLVEHKSGLLTYSYNIGSTRYSIGTIVKENGVYIVRGTFTLYDYYGKISSNYYNETFTVRISGYSITCTTSLD